MKEDLMAKKENNKEDEKFHPWRVCPYGEHWVKVHPLKVPPSETRLGRKLFLNTRGYRQPNQRIKKETF